MSACALPPPQGSLAQALSHLSDFESTTPKEELVEQLVADPVGSVGCRQERIDTDTLCTAARAPQPPLLRTFCWCSHTAALVPLYTRTRTSPSSLHWKPHHTDTTLQPPDFCSSSPTSSMCRLHLSSYRLAPDCPQPSLHAAGPLPVGLRHRLRRRLRALRDPGGAA